MDAEELVALIGFDPGGRSRGELEAAIAGFGRVEAWAAAGRLGAMAAIDDLDDDGVAAEDVARAKTKRSKNACKRAARTAKQLAKMPNTRAALAAGEISEQHVDAAADAAERVSPQQADEDLLGNAKAQPADLFAKGSRSWANAREREENQLDRHLRQRRARKASMWTRADGMMCLYGVFDPVTGQALKKAFDAAVDRSWHADGGRDGTPDEIRTPDQRGADAITELITASSRAEAQPDGQTKARNDGQTEAQPDGKTESWAKAGVARPHPKHVVHLRVDASRIGDDPHGIAEFTNGTPLPQAVLERIACDSAFVAAIYNTNGSILWQGRTKRSATDDQWNALIDRHGGCGICGADPAHCQAHHLIAWAPPTNGPTNIDNMILACNHDHQLIHDHGHQLVKHNGKWTLITPTPDQQQPGQQKQKKQRPPPKARAA